MGPARRRTEPRLASARWLLGLLCLAICFGGDWSCNGAPLASIRLNAAPSQSRKRSSHRRLGAARSPAPGHLQASVLANPDDLGAGRRSILAAGVALALSFGATLAAALTRGDRLAAAAVKGSGATGETLAQLDSTGAVDTDVFPIWESPVAAAAVRQVVAEAGPQGAELGDAEADWPGLWRVVFAPHIRTLGSLALTRFDVYYDLFRADGGGLGIRSYVRFEGPLWSGWLSAAGGVSEVQPPLDVPGLGARPTSEVNFVDFWVDWGAKLPRPAPEASDGLWASLARPLFIRALSRFPTLLFKPGLGLTIFRFPPLGVDIAARRVGPSGAAVRALAA